MLCLGFFNGFVLFPFSQHGYSLALITGMAASSTFKCALLEKISLFVCFEPRVLLDASMMLQYYIQGEKLCTFKSDRRAA